ncbi:hypothetical protein C2G38_2197524 [Gigaspora rosea]|uniref:Protein kinase domain-containing protein n=1 Tax=Gigaspora rosea TaxID=44941 RepID=A0A397UVC8_9GLOM|nr:hypothetical protein C2G38_2197524 [Gigaspora rosea]
MNWKDKLNLLQCIASDLQVIHSQDLIHQDLHNGNILQNDLKGILPYVIPEILNNQPYTKLPAVNKEAPQCYVNLMRKCWDKNLEKRSSAKNLLKNGKKFINTCEITEKLSEMILVSKGIDSTEVSDDN